MIPNENIDILFPQNKEREDESPDSIRPGKTPALDISDEKEVVIKVNPGTPNSENPEIGELKVIISKPEDIKSVTVTIIKKNDEPKSISKFGVDELKPTTDLLSKVQESLPVTDVKTIIVEIVKEPSTSST